MPLRDGFATCPLDQSALDPDPDERKLSCRACGGGLVTEAEVARVLAQVLGDPEPKALPLGTSKEEQPIRTCPRCLNQMTKHSLYEINLDRCEAHGLWFDSEEMAHVLQEAGLKQVKRERFRENLRGAAIAAAFIGAHLIQFLFG